LNQVKRIVQVKKVKNFYQGIANVKDYAYLCHREKEIQQTIKNKGGQNYENKN